MTTSFANPDVAGTAAMVTVMAYDANHNPVSSGPNQYEGTVDFSSTDGQVAGLPATYTFTAADAGSNEFTGVRLETAGSQTITATDSANHTVTGTRPRSPSTRPRPASCLSPSSHRRRQRRAWPSPLSRSSRKRTSTTT